MSRINDALKELQKEPPGNLPKSASMLQSAATESSSSPAATWLVPVIVIFLVVVATVLIGWALTHRTVSAVPVAPQPMKVTQATPQVAQQVSPVSSPVVATAQPVDPAPVSAPPVNPPSAGPANTTSSTNVTPPAKLPDASVPLPALKLQGIFFSSTTPFAILGGQTIRPGDKYKQYRVKAISQRSVTLIGPDKKEIQIGMDK
jgi:hypothetical protein